VPWHEQTTRIPLVVDTVDDGWSTAQPSAPPDARLGDVACTSDGEVVSVAIRQRYMVDVSHKSFPFLQDAPVAGCPMEVDLRDVRVHVSSDTWN